MFFVAQKEMSGGALGGLPAKNAKAQVASVATWGKYGVVHEVAFSLYLSIPRAADSVNSYRKFIMHKLNFKLLARAAAALALFQDLVFL